MTTGGLVFSDPVLEGTIRAGLDRVEDLLRASASSADEFVSMAASHLVAAGGKRFRPMVTLLAAQFGDPAAQGVVEAAVVVELTHLATLYHDDVMDEADRRRGTESANHRWDNTIAILTGDFLFARASRLLADLGPDYVRIQAQTFERLVKGQIHETVGPQVGQDPIEHHLGVLADKTGSLIGTSGRFGAMLSGADEKTTEILTRYGELIGVAFQISDDLLDIASAAEQSGKTPGTDLREGIRTLPVLYALRSDDPGDARLRELLSGELTDDSRHAEALSLLRAHAAMAEAAATLHRWADDARDALSALPISPPKAALEALVDVVVSRTG